MEVHKIEVPLQLPEHLDNLRIVEAVHLHRDLRNRRQQLVGGCQKRIPFSTLDVHLDDQAPARVAVLPDLIFHRVEDMRARIAAAIADTFVVKHEDRKSTRLNSSHSQISYAVFCLKKKMSR